MAPEVAGGFGQKMPLIPEYWRSANGGSGRKLSGTDETAAERNDLTLRQADQARSDFAAIEDGLEFLMAQMSKVPTQKALAWVAAGSFVSGAADAVLVILVLVH